VKLADAKITKFVTFGDSQANVSLLSDEERIAGARERGIENSKRSNADSTFGLGHNAGYWIDYAGAQTSEYDAQVLLSQLFLLHEPRFWNWKETQWVNLGGRYDRSAGYWISGESVVPIVDLRAAVDARIRELNLDPVLVAEFSFGTTREQFGSIEAEQAWRQLPFERQMERFRRK
jgi:hypothetical protein